MPLSNDVAAIIGFLCETLCYGVYCVLFAFSIVFLLFRRPTPHLNLPMLLSNILLFSCCTAHFALEFNHVYTTLRDAGVVQGIANETMPLMVADLMISICDFVGEMVLLYRCWLLWGRVYGVVVIPFVTAIVGLSCIVGVLCLLLTMDPTSPTAPAVLVPLGLAGYILPLLANIIITFLIVYRIWSTSRLARALPENAIASTSLASTNSKDALRRSRPRRSKAAERIHHVMVVVVESGLLYLVTQLTFVVLFAMGHPAQAIVAVIAVQIYGIAPTLIVFRVALAHPPPEGNAAIPERSHGTTSYNSNWNKSRISAPSPYHHQYDSGIPVPGRRGTMGSAPSLTGGSSILESPRRATFLGGASSLSLGGSTLAQENPNVKYMYGFTGDFEMKEMAVGSLKDVEEEDVPGHAL